MVTLLFIVLQLTWLNVCVHSQVVSFNCTTFCPEVPAIYHCVITNTIALWAVADSGGSNSNTLPGNANIGDTRPVGSSFTINKTGSNSFSLSFTANVQFNNSVNVTCEDISFGDSRQCTIELEGPPTTSPSSLSCTAISSTSVNISWSSSLEQCLDYYSVTVTNQNTNQQEIFNTTSTSLTISNRLEGVQYSYTVAVVDGANRSGPQSDGPIPDKVTGLKAIVDLPEYLSQMNKTANITVTWMQQMSPCPNVTEYRVIYNVSDINNDVTTTVLAPTTTLDVIGAIVNSTYSIQVEASNAFGYGPATSITGVVTTSIPIPTSTSLSATTSSITSVVTSLTSTTPTTSTTPPSPPSPPSTGKQGLGIGPIIGIVFGAIVVIVLIVIIVIVIIYIVIKYGQSDGSNNDDVSKPSSKKTTSIAPSTHKNEQNQELLTYADIEPGPMTGSKSSEKNIKPPPEPVQYSDLKHFEQQQYADLEMSGARSGPPKKPPKDRSRVEYSAVQH